MEDFIYEYYINPIVQYEGYNLVNTLTYAAIALMACWLIFMAFRRYKVTLDKAHMLGILSFVLLGSTVRVITDSIDTGAMKPVWFLQEWAVRSGIYEYGFLSVSPGIYVVVAALLLVSMAALRKLGREQELWKVGTALWIPNMLILLPLIRFPVALLVPLALAAIPAYIFYRKLAPSITYSAIVFAHGLDGAATFFAIDIFPRISGIQYWEQHVISRGIGDLFGTYFTFYLLKVGIASLAAWVIARDNDAKEDEKAFVALLLIIIGLAPGIRDILRMAVGA